MRGRKDDKNICCSLHTQPTIHHHAPEIQAKPTHIPECTPKNLHQSHIVSYRVSETACSNATTAMVTMDVKTKVRCQSRDGRTLKKLHNLFSMFMNYTTHSNKQAAVLPGAEHIRCLDTTAGNTNMPSGVCHGFQHHASTDEWTAPESASVACG